MRTLSEICRGRWEAPVSTLIRYVCMHQAMEMKSGFTHPFIPFVSSSPRNCHHGLSFYVFPTYDRGGRSVIPGEATITLTQNSWVANYSLRLHREYRVRTVDLSNSIDEQRLMLPSKEFAPKDERADISVGNFSTMSIPFRVRHQNGRLIFGNTKCTLHVS